MIRLPERFYFFSFFQLFLMTILVIIGFVEFMSFTALIESLGAKRFLHTCFAYALFFFTASSPLRSIHDNAYTLHIIMCLLLLINLFCPSIAGVHRWVRIGSLTIQFSEFAKITTTLALSRYLSSYVSADIRHPSHLIVPVIIVAIPALLILLQPDLGTAILIGVAGLITCYIAGTNKKFFLFLLAATLCSTPILWHFILHDYQKARIISFIKQDNAPQKGDYQLQQSHIAIGSGGMWGKGWRKGSQAQLSFLPEKHTDFIFAAWAEEFGFMGALLLLACFYLLIAHGIRISTVSRNLFGAYTSASLSFMLALYVMVNLAMVNGALPVVGIPLPFISYGGSSLLATFWMMGIISCISMHRVRANI